MEVSRETLEIAQEEIEKMVLLCDVARSNGAPLALKDLAALTTTGATEKELEKLWSENGLLNSRYILSSGFIVERDADPDSRRAHSSRYTDGVSRAQANLATARRFTPFIRSKGVRLISVSGSTSYKFAHQGDDVDFFCVTALDEMWSFILRALLLARLHRLRKREPPLCFSCVMDERRAACEFARASDPLFARDALAAKVMHGKSFFRSLLGLSRWMRRYYPRLYDSEMGFGTTQVIRLPQRRQAKRVLNLYLFGIVGSYIRLKSQLLNRRFRREGRTLSLFEVRLAEDQCVYESARYQSLRATYSDLRRS